MSSRLVNILLLVRRARYGGAPPGVNRSQDDCDNLATLLRARIDGVRRVDPALPMMT